MSRFRMHYKNKPYRLLGTAWHSETQEPLALYECLYPNDRGSLWVRPRDMFFESVEVGGKSVDRFREVPLVVEEVTSIAEAWDRLAPLVEQIFPGTTRAKVEARLASGAFILLASFEGDAVGFKLGYDAGDGTFMSWLGGVRPDRRGLGVGRELMVAQHERLRARGFRLVRTKTLGDWPEMITLNLRGGFRIVGCEPSLRGVKLLFEKELVAP